MHIIIIALAADNPREPAGGQNPGVSYQYLLEKKLKMCPKRIKYTTTENRRASNIHRRRRLTYIIIYYVA